MSDEYVVRLDALDTPVLARCQECGCSAKVDTERPMCYNCKEYPGRGELFRRAERVFGNWTAGFQFVVRQLHTTDNDDEVLAALNEREVLNGTT